MSLKIRRGTNAERLTITPVEGELIYTTDTKNLYIGDGIIAGGKFITGPGYTGSAGTGYTGSSGVGYTGSASTAVGYTGSSGVGYTGSVGFGYTGSAGLQGGTLVSNLNTSTFNITNGSNLTINGNDSSVSALSLKSINNLEFSSNAIISGTSVNINIPTTFYTNSTNFSSNWVSFYSTNNTATSPSVSIGRNRGSISSIQPLQLNDQIGKISFGTLESNGALTISSQILSTIDNTISTGIVPSKIVISTANSSGVLIDSIKINSSQVEMTVPLVVPTYADNTARDTGITAPIKGMIIVVGTAFYGYNGTSWVQLNN